MFAPSKSTDFLPLIFLCWAQFHSAKERGWASPLPEESLEHLRKKIGMEMSLKIFFQGCLEILINMLLILE